MQGNDIIRLLGLISTAELHDELWWKVEGDSVEFFMICSDTFYWGTADAEEINVEDLDTLEKAISDAKNADEKLGDIWAGMLFCARKRKMRPQNRWYDTIPETLHRLFDECGPEREVGIGNAGRINKCDE